MAIIIEISNPFEPLKDTRRSEIAVPMTIREWLAKRFGPDFVEFNKPTVCVFNGKAIMRKEWNRTIQAEDVVHFVAIPQGIETVILFVLYAVLVVAAVVIANNVKPVIPATTPQSNLSGADPVFTLRGQRNQVKLGDPIESGYGRNRHWPSYAAAPFNRYINNDQYFYGLYVIGHGQYDCDPLHVEDTPAANFDAIEYNILPPGTKPSLFPNNVITSPEVSSLELLGPNEPGSGATWIVDVPYDPGDPENGIPPTPEEGHWDYNSNGPYIVNPAGTLTKSIEVDITLPAGLYFNTNNGGISSLSASFEIDAQKIDDEGNVLGAPFTIISEVISAASTTPLRYTFSSGVDEGRYQIFARRLNDKNTSNRAANKLVLESLRCILPNIDDFGDVTMLEVKAKATNNLNDNAQNRFNIYATRKLPIYDIDTGLWSVDMVPTRSPIPAICDVLKARYGGRYPDSLLALDELWALHETYVDESIWFDWIFDQRMTCWDAIKIIARVGRATPIIIGSKFTIIREEPKTVVTAIFNQENIVAGSFRNEVKMPAPDDYDGYLVEYTDPLTGKPETVLCCLEGESGDNPENLKLHGISDRERAWTMGMYFRAIKKYRRRNITFQTGREGIIPRFGSLIGVVSDVVRWGQGGKVVSITGDGSAGSILKLNNEVTFTSGTHQLLLRNRRGESSLPVEVTAGTVPTEVVLVDSINLSDFPILPDREKPLYAFGKTEEWAKKCIVTGLAPTPGEEVEVQCVPYDARIFTIPGIITMPPQGNTGGDRPSTPGLPAASGLEVLRSPSTPGEAIASWNITTGALSYVLQLSYDGVAWDTLANIETTSFRFQVLPKFIYVRVAAMNVGRGAWDYWSGEAPVVPTNVVVDNGVTPNAATSLSVVSGIEFVVYKWTNPSNTQLKTIHIYESLNTTRPPQPTYSVIAPTSQFFRMNVAGGTAMYFWIEVEAMNGRFSSIAGPANGSAALWPDGEDLTPELEALEAKIDKKVFRQPTEPVGPTLWAIWYDTANQNRVKVFDGSGWIDTTDSRLISLISTVSDPTTGLAATRAEVFSGASTWANADTALASAIDAVEAATVAAQNTANAAATSASSAQTSANNAQATANTAVTAAATSQTAANNAQTAANTAQAAAEAAQDTADAAQADATTALGMIGTVASDNVLSPGEKREVIKEVNVINGEQAGIDSQATSYSVTTEKTNYDNAISALNTYLATLTSPTAWNDTSGSTTIVSATFRGKFEDVYLKRQLVLNAISGRAKILADGAQTTANAAVSAASSAQATADGAASAASAAQTTANTAVTNAAGAQTTANAAASAASAAQTTANGAAATASTAVSAAYTAQTTADSAAGAASTAQGTANTANSAAGAAQTTANAAVTSSATAQAGVNSIAAEYVLNVTTAVSGNRRVAGFRITNQGGAGGSTDFVIQADKIAFVNTDGNNSVNPLVIEGGVVYINSAMIKSASITDAMIANLGANKIQAGEVNVALGLNAAVIRTSKISGNVTVFNPADETRTLSSTSHVYAVKFNHVGSEGLSQILYSNETSQAESVDYGPYGSGMGTIITHNDLIFEGWLRGSAGFSSSRFGHSSLRMDINASGWGYYQPYSGMGVPTYHMPIAACYRLRTDGGAWGGWNILQYWDGMIPTISSGGFNLAAPLNGLSLAGNQSIQIGIYQELAPLGHHPPYQYETADCVDYDYENNVCNSYGEPYLTWAGHYGVSFRWYYLVMSARIYNF